MNTRAYSTVSACVFLLATIVHAVRLFEHWPLQIGAVVIPPGASWIGLAAGTVLTIWGFRCARR